MSEKSKRNFVLWFRFLGYLLVLILVIMIPVHYYIQNFKNHEISTSAADWGAFGDYFGGIVNPIIGVFSIVILGYISVKLSENSTEEQKELFFQEQRILAYQELISNRIDFNQSLVAISKQKRLRRKVRGIGVADETRGEKIEFMRTEVLLTKFTVYLHSYGDKYQHLFKYSFKSNEFVDFSNLISFKVNYIIEKLDMENEENQKKHILLGEKEDTKLFQSIIGKLSEEL